MNKTYLGYISALRYWRAVAMGKLPEPKESGRSRVESCARGIREVRACRYLDWDIAEEPLHILVGSPRDARSGNRLVHHICRGSLPAGSLVDVGPELVLPSPSLLLAQLAQTESMLVIAEFAMELCGYYSIDEDSPEGMSYHQPITCVSELEQGLRSLKGRRGASKALAALAYACDGSASPRETESCLALVLPARLGGAALPRPICNGRIEIGDAASKSAQCFYGDLVWPERKLVVEYNGKKYHSDAELDQHRRDLLEHAGWQLRVISKRHTDDSEAFFGKLKQIAHAAGRRFRATFNATSQLRRELFSAAGQLRRTPLGDGAGAWDVGPYPDNWE